MEPDQQHITDHAAGESVQDLNYFNYFTEVEDEFVRRRGKPLLISPMDWALVESWKSAGIPLHIVLRAINQAFDAYEARGHKVRRVNSIFYCQQEVEACFAQYRLAQVGGSQAQTAQGQSSSTRKSRRAPAEPFPREVLLDFTRRCDNDLRLAAEAASQTARTGLSEAIGRARQRLAEIVSDIGQSGRIDAEAIERDFDSIDRLLVSAATDALGDHQLESLRAEAESQLKAYRKRMDRAIYAQTVENLETRRVRELFQLPRLSLFYL